MVLVTLTLNRAGLGLWLTGFPGKHCTEHDIYERYITAAMSRSRMEDETVRHSHAFFQRCNQTFCPQRTASFCDYMRL